jgi:hypothetical protein
LRDGTQQLEILTAGELKAWTGGACLKINCEMRIANCEFVSKESGAEDRKQIFLWERLSPPASPKRLAMAGGQLR